jgi:TrmH family RNA methyltransferase
MALPQTLTSRANPLYRRLRALRDRGGELCLLEGPRLAAEALAAGLAVLEAVATPEAEQAPASRGVVSALRDRGVPVHRMAPALVASLSELETSQGVLALARRPAPDEARVFSGTPLVLVADGVQNPGNLGALVRTAEAAGATGAILAGGCADPFSWKALRGSMGSAFRLPVARRGEVGREIEALLERGLRVVATAADGDLRYDAADLRGPVAVVVGSEGRGLSPAALERASARVRIPLAGAVESLNVAAAAALVLFEAARQRGFPAGGR